MNKYAAVADYGAGNLFSLAGALDAAGIPHIETSDPAVIEAADAVILPGVGAFAVAMERLDECGLTQVIIRQSAAKPFLGICLGMQMLFERSEEFGMTDGLGLIPGSIVRMSFEGLKIPHMGWSDLRIKRDDRLLHGVEEGDYVYFVHSYMAATQDEYLIADTLYGASVPAVVGRGSLYGCQFHPEKSGETGLRILKNFGGLFL